MTASSKRANGLAEESYTWPMVCAMHHLGLDAGPDLVPMHSPYRRQVRWGVERGRPEWQRRFFLGEWYVPHGFYGAKH